MLFRSSGLNNALWYVARYIKFCCQKLPRDGPMCTSVMVLPAIAQDIKLSMVKTSGRGRSLSPHEYGDLFDLNRLTAGILQGHQCCVLSKSAMRGYSRSRRLVVPKSPRMVVPPRIGPFGEFRGEKITSMGNGEFLLALYEHMEVSQRLLHRLAQSCRDAWTRMKEEGYLAVHMRVEKDYYPKHCSEYEKKDPHRVRWCFRPEEIDRIIKNTPGVLSNPHAVLLYAADRMPQDFPDPIKLFPRGNSVTVTNPAKMGCMEGLSYTQRSAVSLVIAMSANDFVGTHKSSMSMGIALQRQASAASTGHHLKTYYYGCALGKYERAIAAPRFDPISYDLCNPLKGCDYT